jgi:anti-sigma regulatory factor (Ser/Thr protein kinase)
MDTILSLELPPDVLYARVLTAAAETLARARGMDTREQIRFQLAADEFFTYLARAMPEHGPIRVVLTGRPYQVRASIRFKASGLCLGALNACCPAAPAGDDEGGEPLSLILAGRVADRFRIDSEGGDSFVLHAEVDKVYPPAAPLAQRIAVRPPYRAAAGADPSLLMHAAALAASKYPAWHCPASFQTPGKFAAMSQAGLYQGVVALDGASHPAGLLCWAKSGDKGLAFSGPFVFAPPGDAPHVARLLVDGFLAAVAREKVDIVFSERATPDVPQGYFESLGSLVLHGRDGAAEQPVLYRHLREDAGETVWAAPEIKDFLRDAYDRLAMCREILEAPPRAAGGRERSLFSVNLDKAKGLAALKPLLDGEDASANLAAHVRALTQKGIANILLYLDLSRAWEAALAVPAAEAGFKPGLVLPFAGRSDLLALQYEHTG